VKIVQQRKREKKLNAKQIKTFVWPKAARAFPLILQQTRARKQTGASA
jgi:hypothetical protein